MMSDTGRKATCGCACGCRTSTEDSVCYWCVREAHVERSKRGGERLLFAGYAAMGLFGYVLGRLS